MKIFSALTVACLAAFFTSSTAVSLNITPNGATLRSSNLNPCAGKAYGWVVSSSNPAEYYQCKDNCVTVTGVCPAGQEYNLALLKCDVASSCSPSSPAQPTTPCSTEPTTPCLTEPTTPCTTTPCVTEPTTVQPTTSQPTTQPTTPKPTTPKPTTPKPTTPQPTTPQPTTPKPTTPQPTTPKPTTPQPTTPKPTTPQPTTTPCPPETTRPTTTPCPPKPTTTPCPCSKTTTTPCSKTTTTPCPCSKTTTTPCPCSKSTTTPCPCSKSTTTPCPPEITTKPCASTDAIKLSAQSAISPPVDTSIIRPARPGKFNSVNDKLAAYTQFVCMDKPDGFMLASLKSCNAYYICRHGQPIEASCGAKYFDALRGLCDFPNKTNCLIATSQ